MKILKRCFLILAVVILIAPARSQDQAGQVAEIQKRLDKARAEEAAAQAGFSKGELKFSDFEAASKKRAALEAELAKAKATPVSAQVAEIQKRLDKARAEEAAAQAAFDEGESKFSDFEAASKKRAALEAELAKAKATASPKAGDEVTVPSVPAGLTVAEAKATLSAAGLTAGFNAKGGKPDSSALEFKTTGAQEPPGGSKAKRGAPVTVSIYQKYEPKTSPTPTAAPSASATPTQEAMVTVPSVKDAGSIDYARTILNQAGFKSAFRALKPEKKEDELSIAYSQPAAGEKAPRGSLVIIFVYQKYDRPTDESSPFVGTWVGKCFYKGEGDPPMTMFIRKDEIGRLVLWVEGNVGGYPLETDGATKLWHKFFNEEITYELVGDTLRGTYRTTHNGRPVTRETILQRK